MSDLIEAPGQDVDLGHYSGRLYEGRPLAFASFGNSSQVEGMLCDTRKREGLQGRGRKIC